jgi:hypothetical protein
MKKHQRVRVKHADTFNNHAGQEGICIGNCVFGEIIEFPDGTMEIYSESQLKVLEIPEPLLDKGCREDLVNRVDSILRFALYTDADDLSDYMVKQQKETAKMLKKELAKIQAIEKVLSKSFIYTETYYTKIKQILNGSENNEPKKS